ncbi:uncharacterized protein K441DRAFT_574963, partial [Cenococcum geophilum 1.58]|uniref:uncharacterized protein n=1 Tax=Cenococcum geophilum 1.58 TaxID=794803 RepID=UPI00358FB980
TFAEALIGYLRDNYIKLNFPSNFRLECLYSLYWVQAATEFLPLGDKRWIIDLYLIGRKFPFYMRNINHKLKTTIIEEYSYKKKPNDSKIYYKIR